MAPPTKDKVRTPKRVVRPCKARVKAKQPAKLQLPKSDDPLEKNVFDDAPMPEGYTFVPKGTVYITRKCRGMTKDSNQVVYKVFDHTDKEHLGIRVPADILEEASKKAEETQESRNAATEARNNKRLNETPQLLQKQFPKMLERDLKAVLEHSFAKGPGRVGRGSTLPDSKRAELAVEAHIRHMHSPFDTIIGDSTPDHVNRSRVMLIVQEIRKSWEGRPNKLAKWRAALARYKN